MVGRPGQPAAPRNLQPGRRRGASPALVWQTVSNRRQLAERILAGQVIGEAGVKGVPFTASGECETITRLSDGNEIRSIIMNTRILRDSEGRVRLETEGAAFIVDPVAGKNSVVFDDMDRILQVDSASLPGAGPEWLKRAREEILLRHGLVQLRVSAR